MFFSKPKPYKDRYYKSEDGLKLYARDYDAAEGAAKLPVFCLHGLTRNSADFEDVAPYLAASGRRVLVWDTRGRGLSAADPNPMNYHPFTYARDVLTLMDSLGIAKAHLIGTSMGGLISMVVATFRPGLIASCTLNDVGPYLSPVGLARIAAIGESKTHEFGYWDEAARYAKAGNGLAFPDYGMGDWRAFAKRLCQKDESGRIRLAYDPHIFDIFSLTTAAPQPFDMSAQYVSLATARPILLVRGAISDLFGAEEAQKTLGLTPDGREAVIDRVGHAPMLSEPKAKAALLEFLKDKA